MSSAGNGLCMCVYVSIHKLYLLPATTSHLSLPDTSVHWNKRERLHHHYSPPLLLSPLSLSLSSLCAISSTQSTAGPPSLRPVSVLFHLACCYRGLDAGRLQLGSQSFSIYQSPPPSVHPSSAGHTHYPRQHQSRHAAIPHHPNAQHTSTLLCSLPPTISSSFDQRRKFGSHAPRQKKKGEILWQWKHSS